MSVLRVIRISPGLMVAASEMCVITLAGAVTFPGHAGVPDILTEVIVLLSDPASDLRVAACCSFFSIWIGLPEMISGNCCLSQTGKRSFRLIAFLSSLLLWTLSNKNRANEYNVGLSALYYTQWLVKIDRFHGE